MKADKNYLLNIINDYLITTNNTNTVIKHKSKTCCELGGGSRICQACGKFNSEPWFYEDKYAQSLAERKFWRAKYKRLNYLLEKIKNIQSDVSAARRQPVQFVNVLIRDLAQNNVDLNYHAVRKFLKSRKLFKYYAIIPFLIHQMGGKQYSLTVEQHKKIVDNFLRIEQI